MRKERTELENEWMGKEWTELQKKMNETENKELN